MRFSVAGETKADLETAWRWWTDYGHPGEEEKLDHGIGRSVRRVVERTGNRVVLEERLPLPGGRSAALGRHEIELRPDEHVVVERADKPIPVETRWVFRSTPSGGTRVEREMSFEGGLGRLVPQWPSRTLAQRDLDTHLRELDAERR